MKQYAEQEAYDEELDDAGNLNTDGISAVIDKPEALAMSSWGHGTGELPRPRSRSLACWCAATSDDPRIRSR